MALLVNPPIQLLPLSYAGVVAPHRTAPQNLRDRGVLNYYIQWAQIDELGNTTTFCIPMSSSTACLTPAWSCPEGL